MNHIFAPSSENNAESEPFGTTSNKKVPFNNR